MIDEPSYRLKPFFGELVYLDAAVAQPGRAPAS